VVFQRLTDAVRRLAQAVERLAVEPDLPMAECGAVALHMQVEHKATDGVDGMSLAISMNDQEQWRFSLVPAVKDADGKQFKTADGVPLTPEMLPVSWDAGENPSVLDLSGIDPSGQTGVIKSGDPGSTTAHATISYPDGSVKGIDVVFAVGFSAPGDPVIEGAVEAEPTA
jgi:hypothetical protein